MGKPLILVTMGTNDYPFFRLYRCIKNDPLYRNEDCEWFVQSGSCDITDLPATGVVEKLIPRDDMEQLVKRSALVISHCGIGSLNLMLQYRKRTIFVPRVASHNEFSDDHQLQIAREIRNKRMTVVYPDDDFPKLDLEQIESDNLITDPVDITNYDLARLVELKLTA